MQEFKIGTKFTPVGRKHRRVYTVTDYLVTKNLAGETVKTRYVAQTTLMGQTVTDHDVVPVTIKRGLIDE